MKKHSKEKRRKLSDKKFFEEKQKLQAIFNKKLQDEKASHSLTLEILKKSHLAVLDTAKKNYTKNLLADTSHTDLNAKLISSTEEPHKFQSKIIKLGGIIDHLQLNLTAIQTKLMTTHDNNTNLIDEKQILDDNLSAMQTSYDKLTAEHKENNVMLDTLTMINDDLRKCKQKHIQKF